MDDHASEVIFNDRILITTHLLPGPHAVNMVRSDQQGCAKSIASTLNDAGKHVGLRGGRAGYETVLMVTIDLRRDDKSHVGVSKVAKGTLKEFRPRRVIRVDLGYNIVSFPVLGAPSVVVAGLSSDAKLAASAVVLGTATSAEVSDS
jgi:hypothetical protein